LVFINASEDSVMVDDVVMFSNPPLTLVKEEELEETLLDVNVSQWSCDEESFERVVRTQVNRSTWDCRLSPNPHALAIYLKFILARGAAAKKV
jgi:hypothetical protein